MDGPMSDLEDAGGLRNRIRSRSQEIDADTNAPLGTTLGQGQERHGWLHEATTAELQTWLDELDGMSPRRQ